MTHPIETVIVDGVAVAKSDVRTYEKVRNILMMSGGVSEVQSTNLLGTLALGITTDDNDVLLYRADPTDTTSAHDGDLILVDAAGLRFKRSTASELALLIANNLSDLDDPKEARSSTGLNIESITTHGDSDYTILATDRVVETSAAFTAARTWTLPAASALNAGQPLTILDAAGGIAGANTLTIQRAGSDTINGGTSHVLSTARAGITLYSNGSNGWRYIPSASISVGELFVNVQDFGAVGDNATDDSGAIQNAVDSLTTGGGTIAMPKSKYFTSTTSITIANRNITLLGVGGDYDETGLTDAPTLIRYTGSGAAIKVGSTSMAAMLEGFCVKNLGIQGTSSGAAGIHFDWNSGSTLYCARSLIENVSVQGFTAGVGILYEFGTSMVLRRTNTFVNGQGIRINGGTVYEMDGIISRINGQGIYLEYVHGLSLFGGSVLEANDGPGLLMVLTADARSVFIENTWFESNNLSGSSTNYQLYITGSSSLRTRNLVIEKCEFNTGGVEDGDIFIDFVEEVEVNRIRSGRSSGATLKVGSTRSAVRYGQCFVTGGSIDPDTNATQMG